MNRDASRHAAGFRVLGVDPGLRITGYAVLEAGMRESTARVIEAGIVRTPGPRNGIAGRLHKVHRSLAELIDHTHPDVLAIEKLFTHYKHPTTAVLMAHVRGVVCLLSGEKNIPLANIPSTHVKKAVTGRGHAGKDQVKRMIQYALGLASPPEPSDVADALAIALAYLSNRDARATRAAGVTPPPLWPRRMTGPISSKSRKEVVG